MPSWQGRSRGNTTGFRIFIWILKVAGVKPAYVLLRFVAGYFFLFSFRSSRFQYRYLRQRQGFGRWKSIRAVYRNYYYFGQTLIDRVVVMAEIPNRFSFDFDGEDHLHQMVAAGSGGLLLSAHMGNWEIAGHLLQRLDTTMNIVMFDGEQEQLKRYLESVTGQRRAKIILIKNDLSHIYAISDALKNNEFVCMHADRFIEGNKTLSAQLLGKAARFPAGPFVLAHTFKMPVSFVFAMKETSSHYHFYATAPAVFRTSGGSTPAAMLAEFSRAMESQLRTYPLQWYNYYDFWA